MYPWRQRRSFLRVSHIKGKGSWNIYPFILPVLWERREVGKEGKGVGIAAQNPSHFHKFCSDSIC